MNMNMGSSNGSRIGIAFAIIACIAVIGCMLWAFGHRPHIRRRRVVTVAGSVLAVAALTTGAISVSSQKVDAGTGPLVINAREGSPQRVPVPEGMPGIVMPHGRPTTPAKVAGTVDGCNRGYGTSGMCVPLQAAGGKPMTCAALTSEGYFRKPLAIHNDNLHLLGKKRVQVITSAGQQYLSGCAD